MSISGLAGKTGSDRLLASRPVSGSAKSWSSGDVCVQPREGQRRKRVSRVDLLGGLREEREERGVVDERPPTSGPEMRTSGSRGTAMSSSLQWST